MDEKHIILAVVLAAVPLRAVSVRPYLEVNGREDKPAGVRVQRAGSRIIVTFRAPREGTYRFGVALFAADLTPLSVTKEAGPQTLRYPYDWTWRNLGNVLASRPRLVMPGVEADGGIYIFDT